MREQKTADEKKIDENPSEEKMLLNHWRLQMHTFPDYKQLRKPNRTDSSVVSATQPSLSRVRSRAKPGRAPKMSRD